jgi:hypothetical protein
MKFSRAFYIPRGAVKVTDKHSDAVAYFYTNLHGQVCAKGFHGKASKPDFDKARRSEVVALSFV